jgi:ComF family protein
VGDLWFWVGYSSILMSNWLSAIQPFLDLFLESQCSLCQRSADRVFCQDCQQRLQRCQISEPQQSWQGALPVFAWGIYGGTLKRSIAALKYDRQPQVARPLGQWLGQAWKIARLAPSQPLTVVPIPMHAAKQQQRGYNQADLIAQAFCQTTGLALRIQGLRRIRATEAQFGLSIADREKNLTAAFELGQDFCRQRPRGSVLLLDDIYTTGATVRSAAEVLRQHQISVCGVVAIARPTQERT